LDVLNAVRNHAQTPLILHRSVVDLAAAWRRAYLTHILTRHLLWLGFIRLVFLLRTIGHRIWNSRCGAVYVSGGLTPMPLAKLTSVIPR
jgi:hypothetical protein